MTRSGGLHAEPADRTGAGKRFSVPATIFTVFLCTLFGANAIAIKISFTGVGVFTAAAIRFSAAAVAISLWALLTGRTFRVNRTAALQLLVFSILFTCQLSLFYLGLSKTNASRGTLLVNLLPFFILLLAHFFIPDDRITGRKLTGMLLGFSGVMFVFLETEGIASSLHVGDLMVLGAAFIWACNTIFLKRVIEGFQPFQIVLYSMVFSAPFFFMEAWFWDDPMVTHIDPAVLGALLYQALVTASFGFIAWNTLLQRYGAVSLHSFVFIMPVSGVLLGGLVLGEPITPNIIAAMGLIVAGILVVHIKAGRQVKVFPLRRGI